MIAFEKDNASFFMQWIGAVRCTVQISLNDLSIGGAEALLPEYSWFSQLVSVLRYAKEQPQLLESQGNGQFSGSTEQGVSFVVTARNKGTVESITVDRYQIKFL